MQPTAKGVYPDAVVHLDHNAGIQTRLECPTSYAQCPVPSAQCPMPNAQCLINAQCLDKMDHRHEDAHLDHGACRGRATQQHDHHHQHNNYCCCCYYHHHCYYCYHYCCYRGYRGRVALGGRHAPHGCWCIDEPHG